MAAVNDPFTYELIGALMEVHRVLGPGCLERVYQEATALEFASRGLPFRREVDMPIWYKQVKLETGYRADFLCHEEVILELKAIPALGQVEKAQTLNYLRAARKSVALLVNFGADSLEWRRFLYKWPDSGTRNEGETTGPAPS